MSYSKWIYLKLVALTVLAIGQPACYVGPGSRNRALSGVVPCVESGESACCLLGDVCLPGNSCWNYDTGDTYQYGCTDINYADASCPYKCGWNTSRLPHQKSYV